MHSPRIGAAGATMETISLGMNARVTIEGGAYGAARAPMDRNSFAYLHFTFSPFASPVIVNGMPIR